MKLHMADDKVVSASSSVGGTPVTGFQITWKTPNTGRKPPSLRSLNSRLTARYGAVMQSAARNTLRLTGQPSL